MISIKDLFSLSSIEGAVNAYVIVRRKIVQEYRSALSDNASLLSKKPEFSLDNAKIEALTRGFETSFNEVETSYSDFIKFASITSALASKPNNMMRMTIVIIALLRETNWSDTCIKEAFITFFKKLADKGGRIKEACYSIADSTTYATDIYALFEYFPIQDSHVNHNNYGGVGNDIVSESEEFCEKGVLPNRHTRDLSRKAEAEAKKQVKDMEDLAKKFRDK
jgi:hypothetical protein